MPARILSLLHAAERRDGVSHVVPGASVPIAGNLMSLLIAMASISSLSICLSQRLLAIKKWSNVPWAVWLTFAIYIDSLAFVIFTTILQQSFGVNTSFTACTIAMWLCLGCYVTTKIFIYLFLVEKAHIIRSNGKRRLKSKLYCFNSFAMIGIYAIIAIFNFVFRIIKIDDNGVCIIGMQKNVMIPLISFDAAVNVYLTILFLIPLRNLYSFKNMNKSNANIRLRNVAFRTFVGSCCTLVSSIVNLTILMVLEGEPGWICLICCNSDVLFSALVIQWVTSKDNAGSGSASNTSPNSHAGNSHAARDTISSSRPRKPTRPTPTSAQGSDDEISLVDVSKPQSSNDGQFIDACKVASRDGAVIVTTTIHRQSSSTTTLGSDGMQDGRSQDMGDGAYGYPPASATYGVGNHHDEPETLRTYISGGKDGQGNRT